MKTYDTGIMKLQYETEEELLVLKAMYPNDDDDDPYDYDLPCPPPPAFGE